MADDDTEGPLPHRLEIRVAAETYAYLQALKRHKTHGNTVTAIVRRFIDDGIQDAIDRKYITLQGSTEEGAA